MHTTRSDIGRDLHASRPTDVRARVWWTWAVCAFLVLAVGLVFGQTLGHEFLGYDDDGFVFKNPLVTPGLTLAGLRYALSDGPYGEWCPLTTLSHQLDCQLYDLHPAGHYLTNVLLHAASSVLLFLVLLRMTVQFWPSAWVAAIFAIHPLHVESVAWIAERRDVLSGLFFMLTLGAYALYAERPSLARYLAVAGLALGLTAKPMLVTVPFLLILPTTGRSADFAFCQCNGTDRIGLMARSLADPLEARSRKDPPHRLGGDQLRNCPGEPRIVAAKRSSRAAVARAAPRQCRGCLRGLLGSVFLSRRLVCLLSASWHRLAVAGVAGSLILLLTITAVALIFWRPPALSVSGLALVFGHARSRHRIDGGLHSSPGHRYMYLSQIGLSIALAWGVLSLYQSRQSLERSLATLDTRGGIALCRARWPPSRGDKFPIGVISSRSGRTFGRLHR